MTTKILSIEIKVASIAATLIHSGLKGNRVEFVKELPLVTDDSSKTHVKDRLLELLGEIDTDGAVALVSCPPQIAFYRNIYLPFHDEKKIRQVLPMELEPFLPFDSSNALIDFHCRRVGEHSHVLACVAQLDDINMVRDVLASADISCRVATPPGFPIAEALIHLSVDSPDDFMVIHADGDGYTFVAIDNSEILTARFRRCKAGNNYDETAARLAKEIRFLEAACEPLAGIDFTPTSIYLAGFGNHAVEISDILSHMLGKRVKPFKFYEDITAKIGPLPDDCNMEPDAFSNALSMAAMELSGITGINFVRQEYILQKYWGENRNEIISTFMLMLFVAVFLIFEVVVEAHFLQEKAAYLKAQTIEIFKATLPQETVIVDPVAQLRKAVDSIKEKKSYGHGLSNHITNIDILNDISRLIPENVSVVLTRYTRDENKVIISGTTDTFNSVDAIKNGLARSAYFTEITISSANMDKNSNRVRFKIKATLAS